MRYILDTFKIIAFTHKSLPLDLIGKLQLTEQDQKTNLPLLKLNFNFSEVLYLNTCNRVELYIVADHAVEESLIKEIINALNGQLTEKEIDTIASSCEVYNGDEAVKHTYKVAASLESLVIGEREIIAQVRKAYESCNLLGLTGDFIRLLIKQTIETGKLIYTHTNIAKNPVSIVSLAYRTLKQHGIKNNAKLVFVGSGETNTLMATYLKKHSFENSVVFNRTLSNAEKLAMSLGGEAYDLNQLATYTGGFDVMIVCTSSTNPLIDTAIYNQLNQNHSSKKIIIDLGLPANVDKEVIKSQNLVYIDINSLKEQADNNVKLRQAEIVKCEDIISSKVDEFKWLHKERRIELAFGEIPRQIKAIKDVAINEVFTKEINDLDNNSKEVLEKVLSYVEKKYNAVAFKTAKELLLSKND